MASAIFVVPIENSGPVLPLELIQDGTLGYGFSAIGQIPVTGSCLVRVWASDAELDIMAADDTFLFVEDVANG